MILLKKVRLINWYGFSNVTAPIGFFTLIAGKNGNGKSVMLDAIKYAAYGDTVFNKSSESKGSRTLSSYTRGLLDATAGTYMRPADQVPNVYTHIVMEYFDNVEEKSFLLGTVIETSASNQFQTYRYVIDRKTMEQIDHTYEKDGVRNPFSASLLQKKYRLTLLNREQGLKKFLQMTGLKLYLDQLPVYLRKLRGIMSYDPNARIDRFIRESVLEKRDVDFKKLIEARENIERLNNSFEGIQQEIEELDEILEQYDAWESGTKRLLLDDIRIVYKRKKELHQEKERLTKEQELASRRRDDLERELEILDEEKKKIDAHLVQARVSLEQLDSTRMIAEESRKLEELEAEKKALTTLCRKLEHFQNVVNERMNFFLKEGEEIEDKDVLSSLCGRNHTAAQKAEAAARLKQKTSAYYDKLVMKMADIAKRLEECSSRLDAQNRIIEECKRHRNTFAQIPEYVGLRDEINREFEKRKIRAKAQFACEYVIALNDEAWRDAIEAFLGPRRYTILVDPQYYDIADEILNRSEYRYAHLFNTKLLMKKKISVEEDSVVFKLEIKNPVARQYFHYQLGRMHAVDRNAVKEYENAISVEGRVSVAMDSSFLRFDRLRSYYLGQRTFELNRIRAEEEISRLKEDRKELLSEQKEIIDQKKRLELEREMFQEYDYDAHGKYQSVSEAARASRSQLERLRQAQKNNLEYLELHELVGSLLEKQEAVRMEYREKLQEKSRHDTTIQRCSDKIAAALSNLTAQEKKFQEYKQEYADTVRQAVETYEKYLQQGKKGAGGLLAEESRMRIVRGIERNKSLLMQRQADYHAKHPGQTLLPRGTEGREQYAGRRARIWMDNLQEIRQKLEDQTRRYEDIFKNEFVLTILKSCERAREDLRQINRELARLNFSAKYQFDVHYVADGSEYAKVIDYARYLDEREQMGSRADGQMTFSMLTSVSDEEGEQLEAEMKQIINRIIEKNSDEAIERFADYRNYMNYEILISNDVLDRAKLSRQTGYNSGAEVQIPYLLILLSALLLIYNQRVNSTRLVFIDEPFAKMDPGNVKLMLDFMREQKLQVIFCSPDKTESIGNECEVILPVLRVRADSMQLGIVQFHEQKADDIR